MADYWLTRELLQLVGLAYVGVFCIAIGLALWLPKHWLVKSAVALIVVALFAQLPLQARRQHAAEEVKATTFRARLAEARALFGERCKSSGEKIYQRVSGVDGVFLMKLRPEGVNRADQYTFDDPYGYYFGGEGYIKSFLMGRTASGLLTENHTKGGFRFVEFEDSQQRLQRVRGALIPRASKDYFDLRLEKTQVSSRTARYGIDWADISTKEDRDQWIAGSLLRIVDLSTNEIVGERVGYMFDAGLGAQGGGRSPWLFAAEQACPPFGTTPSGHPIKWTRSLDFVVRVLNPNQAS